MRFSFSAVLQTVGVVYLKLFFFWWALLIHMSHGFQGCNQRTGRQQLRTPSTGQGAVSKETRKLLKAGDGQKVVD